MIETLGEYLRKIRKEKQGLSLRELSRRAGISHSYLSQIENGNTKNPKSYILRALAQELGIDYKILMYKAGYIKGEEYEHSYVKENAALIETLPKNQRSIDLAEILRDQEKNFYFHNTSLNHSEINFIYNLLQIISEENQSVDKEILDKILEMAEILLK